VVIRRSNSDIFDALVEFIGPTGFVSPNRMNFKPGSDPDDLALLNFRVNGQNTCNRG
jgi:hypothetical protein